MLNQVLKSETFNVFFSFVLGVASIAILKPVCKGESCILHKAPPFEELSHSTYQLGSKCYKFRGTPLECPASGVIEAFSVKRAN